MKLREDKTSADTSSPAAAQNGSGTTPPKTEVPKAEAPKAAPKPKNKSGFQVVLRQIGLALLFLVIGMLGILLALYLPASRDLKNAQTELERLAPIETQYLELQQSSAKIEQQGLVYKLMSETTQLRSALDENDNNKATQYLTYMEEDLSQLDLSEFPDLPTSLTDQFNKIKTSISSAPTSAGSEVDKFYNSLLTLSDNLQ
jgi:type II secretory pathway pseudopilin PulG